MTHQNNFGSACVSLWIYQGCKGSEELNLSKSSQLIYITRAKWLTVVPWLVRGSDMSRVTFDPRCLENRRESGVF